MLNKRQHVYGFRNFNHNLNYVTMIQNYNQNISIDDDCMIVNTTTTGWCLWEYIVEYIHNATLDM